MFDTNSQYPPTDNVKRMLAAGAGQLTHGVGVRPEDGLHDLLISYSHSMVPGGLLVTSSTTRLTSATSLVIRVEIRSSTS